MGKIDRKNVIISIILIVVPLIFSLLYFVYTNFVGKDAFFSIYPKELSLISCFSFWWFLIRFDIYSYYAYLLPLIITYLGCYSFFQVYHSGFVTYCSQRTNYTKFMKGMVLKSWKKSLLLPILFGIFFLISYLIFPNCNVINSNNFDHLLYPFQTGHQYMTILNPYLFVILYLIMIFLYGIFIINLGMIICKFVKKFSLFVIANYVAFMALENIFNFFVAPVFKMLTNNEKMLNGFSILNLYYLDGIPSLVWEFCWGTFLIIITTFIISKLYCNRENVLNDYE